jgi:hypothetical protein
MAHIVGRLRARERHQPRFDGQAKFSLRSFSTQTLKTPNLLASVAATTEYWFQNADDSGSACMRHG